METFHRLVHWVVLFSLAGHVFCCVLPLGISLLSVAAGLGVLSGFMPALDGVHALMHGYEGALIAFSGTMLALGWAAQYGSRRVDCHDTGCVHPPCDGKKARNSRVMVGATVLFIVNLAVLLFVHNRDAMHP